MKHTRTRSDWPIRAYRFWCRPTGDLPPSVWRAADRLQGLWNQLAAAHALIRQRKDADYRAKSERVCLCGAACETAAWVWNRVSRELVKTVALETAHNQWAENANDTLTRFNAAVSEAPKRVKLVRNAAGDIIARMPGWPRSSGDVDRVMFVLKRWTGGGGPLKNLWNRALTGVAMTQPVATAYRDALRETRRQRLTRGHTDLFGERVELEVLAHRSIPPDAILKRAQLCGERIGVRWEWALIVIVEEPPVPQPERPGRAEIRLGWTRVGEHLRIATVTPDDGEPWEILLPLAPSSSRRARQWGRWFDPSLGGISDLDARIAKELDAAKETVTPLLAGTLYTIYDRTRDAGLLRRLRKLDAAAAEHPLPESVESARQALRAWAPSHERWRSIRREAFRWWVRRRRNIYEQYALDLCRRYGTLVDSKALNLAKLARGKRGKGRPDDAYALDAGDKYRQWAAPGEFRLIVKRAAARLGTKWESGTSQTGGSG